MAMLRALALALLPLSGAALAQDGTVRLTTAQCRYLERHQPDADVAYKPGVDVHGRPVAPADLDGGRQVEVRPDVVIDLAVPLADFLAPGRLRRQLGGSDIHVGTLEVDLASGLVRYDGQLLTDPERARLVAVCRSLARRR